MTQRPSAARRLRGTRLLAVLALMGLSGCSTTIIAPSGAAAVAPQLTVERFLQAANDRDLNSMSRLFGSAQGPIGDTGSTFGCFWKKIGSWFGGEDCLKRSEVEIRLDVIARTLEHEDYLIVDDEPVAGRASPTQRVFVDFRLDRDVRVERVPFVVVQGDEDQWLVQEVALERILQAGGV